MSPRCLITTTAVSAGVLLAGCGSSQTHSATSASTSTAAPAASTSSTSSAAAVASQTATTSSSGSASQARSRAARDYIAAVLPLNSALVTFAQRTAKAPASSTGAQIEALAAPYIQALTTTRVKLRAVAAEYPPAAGDLDRLISALAAIQADTEAIGHVSSFTSAAGRAQEAVVRRANLRDEAAARVAGAAVRTDLGLPQHGT